jgi:phage antirepressor YoqD-like protein
MSVATTAVLLIMADDNAVPSNKRKVDFILEPLNRLLDKWRNMLVRSKANEQITKSIKVTSPGLTALVKISSTETNDKARHTSTVIEKTRSGTRLYFTKLIKVIINTTIINHCSVVIITSLIIKKTRHKQKLLMASVYSGLDKIYEG